MHFNAAIEKQNQKGGRKKTRLTFWETKGNLNERRDYRTLSKMKYSLRLLGNGVEAGLGGDPYSSPLLSLSCRFSPLMRQKEGGVVLHSDLSPK